MQLIHHIQATGKNPASVQKQWRRMEQAGKLSRPFSRDLEPTPEELALVFGQKQSKPSVTTARVVPGLERKVIGRFVSDTDTPPIAQTDRQAAKQTVKQTRTRTSGQRAMLVGIMVVCASVSLSNMYDIAGQIKTSRIDAGLITALFSLAPFGMLYAGVSQWASWLVSGICIAFEVFCNTAGMYRGLAGLGRSGKPYEVWDPGGFIDTVSRVTTLEPRPCALAISVGMAAIVAGVFLVCLIELKKC